MHATFHNLTIECLEGDITNQSDVDAIVNAANARLQSGGGVAGAIHRAAGPQLDAACRRLAPIHPGQTVISPAFDLPNRFVVHALGPVYGSDEPAAELLTSCYRGAVALAEKHKLTSIAFPAISTGVFGYPVGEAAVIAISAVAEQAPLLRSVRLARFVLWGAESLQAHQNALRQIT